MAWNNIIPATILREGTNMNLELEAYEGELAMLRRCFQLVKHTGLAEKMGNIYFICGEGGEKDKNGLPDSIYICPAYGVDWFQVYEKSQSSVGPEY
jgi:hypothetical protein